MLYFRDEELKKIDEFMSSSTKRAMAVYGRRRTGKTKLITEYIKTSDRRDIVYYQASSYDYESCLEDFKAVLAVCMPGDSILAALKSFKDVFTYITNFSKRIKAVVIDEFPFIAKKNDNVPAEFQWIIDHGPAGIKLILLGSNMSFMRRQINGSESPLYGRFDDILEIRPFSFRQVLELFPDFSDAMDVYAQTGGVAQYVMFFKDQKNVTDASRSLFFDHNGRLFQESGNMLLQELRDPTTYVSILRAIGSRDKDSGQIAKKSGMDSRALYPYITKLIDLGFVSTVSNPLGGKQKDVRYRISDQLFRFNYTFIEPNISIINAIGSDSREHILGSHFSEYCGTVYEDIIRENCFHYALKGVLPFMPVTSAKWWGNIKDQGNWIESELDVAAFDNDNVVLGECKYRTKAAGLKELQELENKAEYIPLHGRTKYYLLASRSGFTDELLKLERPDLILISGIDPVGR